MDALRYALFTHLRPRTETENVEEQDLLEKYGHMVPSIAEEALG